MPLPLRNRKSKENYTMPQSKSVRAIPKVRECSELLFAPLLPNKEIINKVMIRKVLSTKHEDMEDRGLKQQLSLS